MKQQSGCTILHSQQQYMRFPISPHLHHHLLLSVILIVAVLVGMKWHCGFDLHFPDGWWCGAYFHMLIDICVSLGEMSIGILCPFFMWVVFLLLSCRNALYILDRNLFSNIIYKYRYTLEMLQVQFQTIKIKQTLQESKSHKCFGFPGHMKVMFTVVC